MEEKYSSLEKTAKENLVLSYKPLKVGALHPFGRFDEWAGVYRVLQANFNALKKHYPNLEPVYIAGSFDNYSLEGKEKRKLDLSDFWDDAAYLSYDNPVAIRKVKEFEGQVKKNISDLDALFVENLYRGSNWIYSKAVRNVLNKYDKGTIIRNHDWIGNYLAEIVSFFRGFKKHPYDLFSKNPDIVLAALTSSVQHQINKYCTPREVQILKNSIVFDDFVKKDDGKDEQLREILLEKGIFEDGLVPVGYLVRPDARKNLFEAVYTTKLLDETFRKKHKLIIPLAPSNPTQKKYTKEIKEFALELNVALSIGEASKYLKDPFNAGNFLHNTWLALQTATSGGFELSHVESPAAGTPMIGRKIREVYEDFELNGMKLLDDPHCKIGCLWDNSILPVGEYGTSKTEIREAAKKLNLEMRVDYSIKNTEHNAIIARDVYGDDVIVQEIIKWFKLPGYEKLEQKVA